MHAVRNLAWLPTAFTGYSWISSTCIWKYWYMIPMQATTTSLQLLLVIYMSYSTVLSPTLNPYPANVENMVSPY